MPPLYDRWLTAALGEPIEAEPRATCSDCVMTPRPGERAPERLFDAATKCCTFYPHLWNFNVGGVLAGGESPAATTILARIAGGAGVSPLGIASPAVYRTIYNQATKSFGSFGRVPQLRCPFYIEVGGMCGIHRHRDAICSTWFCKFDRGVAGRVYWNAVKELVKQIERGLRLHCITTLELGASAFEVAMTTDPFNKPLDEHDLRRGRDEALHRRTWGRWAGREREFYLACAELVATLEWPDVARLAGAEGTALLALVGKLKRAMQALPAQVSVGTGALVQISPKPGQARLTHPSLFYDFADVPAAPLSSLRKLEGRPLADALAELRAAGVALDDELVRTLLDYRVLVPAPLSDDAS